MEIIDAQIHEPRVRAQVSGDGRPDIEYLLKVEGTREAMDSVGVDAALVFASRSHIDACVTRYPDRFAGIPTLDDATDGLEPQVATLRRHPGYLGFQCHPINSVSMNPELNLATGRLEPLFALAEKYDVPLFVAAHGRARLLEPIACEYPGLSMIINHLGASQSSTSQSATEELFDVQGLLSLARYPNVCLSLADMMVSSGPRIPPKRIWPSLFKIIREFGPERIVWGSSRWAASTSVVDSIPYCDYVNFLRDTNEISEDDKAQILGQSLRRVLRWTPLPPVQQWSW